MEKPTREEKSLGQEILSQDEINALLEVVEDDYEDETEREKNELFRIFRSAKITGDVLEGLNVCISLKDFEKIVSFVRDV